MFAALSGFALWFAGLLSPIEDAFVLTPANGAEPLTPGIPIVVALLIAASMSVAIAVKHFGARRSLPYLTVGFVGLALLSLSLSTLVSIDIEFTPIAFAGLIAAVTIQTYRLRERDAQLADRLNASSARLESIKNGDIEHRVQSGLKLLDTVLSLKEAIVFRRDHEGRLVPCARLRAGTNTLDTAQNHTWRGAVSFCERAIKQTEMIVEEKEGEPANIALPLTHEGNAVGVLLLRSDQIVDGDRALLNAVGSQMARNLQRDQARNLRGSIHALSFFSAKQSADKLQSLSVLNGALLEQRIGLTALSEVNDGVALAYLDGRIASVNNALLKLAQVTADQTQGFDFFELLDLFRTDVFDEPAIALRRVLQTGEPYECELHLGDREQVYGLRISLVFDDADSAINQSRVPVGFALIVTDLTRIKEFEQLKSDMISLMSHELRTPLTSINGFAELLNADEELPEQAKEFVGIIATESQRLSRMINTFLAVTKLERKDRQEVLKIPLRLDEVVRETIATLQTAAKKRRIRLVEQPAQTLPPVAADKSMITQAVKNLVSNAIKYSPERTTVTVSTKLEAEAVRLCVEDRGYGIPTEAKDRVWEKFYRVVREGEDKDEESTGLGLSFVREVVEQHGGRVDLESEVGRGSKFSFTLPRL